MKLIGKLVCSVSLGMLAVLSTTVPLQAASTINIVYGPLKKSIRISALENFVKTGKVERNLEFFFRSSSTEQKEEFRQALVKKVPVNGAIVSRFLNSNIGEDVLERFGRVVSLPRGTNGKFALRGSIVKAALSAEGLTLINVLRNFPTDIQINGEVLLKVHKAVEQFVASTKEGVQTLQALALKEAESDTQVDFSKMSDLSNPGPYSYQKETWQLKDESRNRSLYAIVYKPKVAGDQKIPVVILSHGLASRPEDFNSSASSLASNGFFVVLPQHPGSDYKHLQDFIKGFTRQIFETEEFINRPKDITFVIDELEKRNQGEYQGRLNLQQVGVIGHSFGGYTALAVAGAQIDFENLTKACKRFGYLNISLLLQCRALDLPRKEYKMADSRVTAIMARNSLNSSIFGRRGLAKVSVPTMLLAGSLDITTPVVHEQMFSFPFLTKTPESYLGLVEGQNHVDLSQLDAGITELIESTTDLVLPTPELVNTYTNAASVAFFKVFLVSAQEYMPFLQSSYAVFLSKNEKFKFSWLTNRSKEAVRVEVERLEKRFVLGR